MSSLFGAFLRPVGAAVDVKELEYVSAIHQTGKEIDEDGFITAQDVQVFLRSRFGAVITKEDAIDIVRGLAGSTRLPLPKAANDTNCNSATTRSFLSFSRGEDKEKEKQKINVEHKQPIIETGMSSGDNIEVPLKDPTSGEQNNLKKNDKSDQNDEEHYAEALQDVSDVRRQWKFQKDVPKKKDKTLKETELLVRYDIVQLLTILYIPTLLRLKHHRLDRSAPFASASFYGAQCCIKYLIPSKWVSRFVQRKENTYKAMKQKLLPKPQNLMEDVLNILLEKMQDDSELRASLDNTASIMGNDNKSGLPKLSKRIFVSEKLVQSMLVCIGEEKSARDEQLVKQMVEAVGGEGSVFNELSFARALTDDVEAWPIESEDNLTTSFYDVYGFDENECLMHKEENKTIEEEQGEEGQETAADLEVEASQKSPRSRVPNYKNTLSFIDYAADAYQSNAFVVFLFTFYTISAIFIVLVLNDQILVGSCDDGGFWCLLGRTVFDWLVFALTLIASGFIILYPISLGNNAHSQRIYPNLLSIVLLVLYIAVSRAGLDELVKNGEDHFEGSTHWYMTILWTAMTIAAVLTLVSLVKNLIPKLLPNKLKQNMLLKSFLLSSNTLRTAKQKKAATNKINLMIQNAYELHVDAHKSASGANAEHQTILNFVVNGEKPVKCGGLIWTWKAMFQKTMFEVEGVWLHARLLIAQAMQIIISIIIGVVWYEGTFSLADQVEHDREEAEEKGNTYALYFIPTRAAIVYPFMIGGIITLTFACLLILVYIPTTSAMVLKFRSGVLPSLHDPKFIRFRKCPDAIYFNAGNMIYGLVGSASLFFFIFAGLLFLVAWNPTRPFMISVIGWGLGLTITVVLKMVITGCFRSRNHKGLYRSKPGAANLSSVALECWHLGLAGGVLIGRLTQFLLAMAFWIGRIDSVFLSDEVDMLGYRFDTVPHKFVSEVLVHDAHRHPYIERLAAMYLMRYKYGDAFGSDAGAAWRRIFVSTLFPWILKYKETMEEEDEEEEEEEEEDTKMIDNRASF